MIKEKYNLWLKKAVKDPDLINELKAMENNEELISDAFYTDLQFGTAGLRGVIGAGTNRMNVYTVGKASQGLAAYVNSVTHNGSIAIAYDSRIKSTEFAKTAAGVFAANGIKVYIYRELMPTPMLSYAVRSLKCDAGIVITASHNPAKYNGYKAYGSDGCQLGPDAADYVLSIMNSVDIFEGVRAIDFEDGIKSGAIEYISDSIIEGYLCEVEKRRVSTELDLSDFKVIYTPLNGTGNKPVRNILGRMGIKNVTVVPEQELPDGNFTTAPYPNPEIRQAFECALKLSDEVNPDLILATDPDADRVGIAIKVDDNYRLFSGNEVGALLLNYILSRRKANGTLPEKPFAVKTIVTTELVCKIAEKYGCELANVLTGFKFIGGEILKLEQKGEEERFVFGFEESYGYLAGGYVRDKDAVVASMLICEMTAYYKSLGKSLYDVLNDIYEEFGYYLCVQKSFTCEGQSGMKRISDTMVSLRSEPITELCGSKVTVFKDFEESLSRNMATGKVEAIDLPSSNVLGYYLEDSCSIIVRPSGTEPKIKLYVTAVEKTEKAAKERLEKLLAAGTELLGF